MSAAIELLEVRTETAGESWDLDITLSVEAGECVALLGPARAGKSFILELCAGLQSPAAGIVRVCGRDLSVMATEEWSELRTEVGTVLQQPGLLSNMTLFNNVALPLRYHRGHLGEERINSEVMTHFAALGLEALRDRFPAQLNQGEIRCGAIARAMVLGQNVLLLDEPTSGLDAEMTRRLAQYLAGVRLARPLTVLASLRRYSEFLEIADRVVFLRDGRVLASGIPETLATIRDVDMRGYLFPDGRTPLIPPTSKRGTP